MLKYFVAWKGVREGMIRVGVSIVVGFILIYLQSLIVMAINGSSSLKFHEPSYFFLVWVINFFWSFTLFSHISLWLRKKAIASEK